MSLKDIRALCPDLGTRHAERLHARIRTLAGVTDKGLLDVEIDPAYPSPTVVGLGPHWVNTKGQTVQPSWGMKQDRERYYRPSTKKILLSREALAREVEATRGRAESA